MEHPIHWDHIFGNLPPVFVHAVAVWVIVLLLAVLASGKLTLIPSGVQKVMEYFFDFVRGYSRDLIGPEHRTYDPLFVGIFFFIFVSNLWGIVPGMLSPTANLNTNFSIAIVVFLATHFYGMRKQGVVPYLNQFSGPVPFWLKPFMFFIEIISHVARPVSLSFRLFGNIVAKEILLLILATLVLQFAGSTQAIGQALTVFPALLYPLLIVLGAFICFIQAFVFMLLAQVYVAGALSEHH